MYKNVKQAYILILTFTITYIYRYQFQDDFTYKGLLQIILIVLFDCLISFILFNAFLKIYKYTIKIQNHKLLNVVLFIISYFITTQLLINIHVIITKYTLGLSERYLYLQKLSSYQVFDTYLVIAYNLILFITYYFIMQWSKEKELKKIIKKEKIEMELNYLKAQVNPHFLFNTLNNIYFLIDHNNNIARDSIHHLSEIMRYQIEEVKKGKTSLFAEIQNISNFLNLHKIRKNKNFKLKVENDVKFDAEISPLLLIILAENAIKFTGNSTLDFVHIKVELEHKNELTFRCINSLDEYAKKNLKGSKIGINNLKKRLTLEYPNEHNLSIYENKKTYESILRIKL